MHGRKAHIEGVLQHENDGAWWHSFRMVSAPRAMGRRFEG